MLNDAAWEFPIWRRCFQWKLLSRCSSQKVFPTLRRCHARKNSLGFAVWGVLSTALQMSRLWWWSVQKHFLAHWHCVIYRGLAGLVSLFQTSTLPSMLLFPGSALLTCVLFLDLDTCAPNYTCDTKWAPDYERNSISMASLGGQRFNRFPLLLNILSCQFSNQYKYTRNEGFSFIYSTISSHSKLFWGIMLWTKNMTYCKVKKIHSTCLTCNLIQNTLHLLLFCWHASRWSSSVFPNVYIPDSSWREQSPSQVSPVVTLSQHYLMRNVISSLIYMKNYPIFW